MEKEFFEYHENCCTNYAWCYKQGYDQGLYDGKNVVIRVKPTGLGLKWAKILNLNVILSKNMFWHSNLTVSLI